MPKMSNVFDRIRLNYPTCGKALSKLEIRDHTVLLSLSQIFPKSYAGDFQPGTHIRICDMDISRKRIRYTGVGAVHEDAL
jgi:hypothetical protein